MLPVQNEDTSASPPNPAITVPDVMIPSVDPAPAAAPLPGRILFNDAENFAPPMRRMFVASSAERTSASASNSASALSKLFGWRVQASYPLAVKRIRWLARGESASLFDGSSFVIQDVNLTTSGFASNGAITAANTTSALLALSNEEVARYYSLDMTLRLDWEHTLNTTHLQPGFSQSGIFTVVASATESDRIAFDGTAAANVNDLKGEELVYPAETFSSTATNATASGAEGTGAPAGRIGGTSRPHYHSEDQGGLSTGAKAGIGAGVSIAGLLILGALLFFFLRRRRSRQRGAGSSLLIPDPQKLANEASPSPPPPSVPQIPPAVQEDEHRALRAPSTSSRGGIEGGVGMPPGCEDVTHGHVPLPAGVSRHLVEEGMTREQILLLEEEERQLDAEIERAARRL